MTLAAWPAVPTDVAPERIIIVMTPGTFDHVCMPLMKKCHKRPLMIPKLTGVDPNHFFLGMNGGK